MVNYEKYDFWGFTQASCKSDFTSLASAFWNDSRVANRPGTLGTVCLGHTVCRSSCRWWCLFDTNYTFNLQYQEEAAWQVLIFKAGIFWLTEKSGIFFFGFTCYFRAKIRITHAEPCNWSIAIWIFWNSFSLSLPLSLSLGWIKKTGFKWVQMCWLWSPALLIWRLFHIFEYSNCFCLYFESMWSICIALFSAKTWRDFDRQLAFVLHVADSYYNKL